MGDDSAIRDPGDCSFSSLPRATNPTLSCVSSPLCPPLLEPRVSGCKQNFVHWPFKSLFVFPALCPWWIETLLLFTAGCSLGSFVALVYRLGSSAWGLDPTLLRGTTPLVTKISLWNFNCHLWEPSQSSCTFSTFPTSLVVVKWFLLSP